MCLCSACLYSLSLNSYYHRYLVNLVKKYAAGINEKYQTSRPKIMSEEPQHVSVSQPGHAKPNPNCRNWFTVFKSIGSQNARQGLVLVNNTNSNARYLSECVDRLDTVKVILEKFIRISSTFLLVFLGVGCCRPHKTRLQIVKFTLTRFTHQQNLFFKPVQLLPVCNYCINKTKGLDRFFRGPLRRSDYPIVCR